MRCPGGGDAARAEGWRSRGGGRAEVWRHTGAYWRMGEWAYGRAGGSLWGFGWAEGCMGRGRRGGGAGARMDGRADARMGRWADG